MGMDDAGRTLGAVDGQREVNKEGGHWDLSIAKQDDSLKVFKLAALFQALSLFLSKVLVQALLSSFCYDRKTFLFFGS